MQEAVCTILMMVFGMTRLGREPAKWNKYIHKRCAAYSDLLDGGRDANPQNGINIYIKAVGRNLTFSMAAFLLFLVPPPPPMPGVVSLSFFLTCSRGLGGGEGGWLAHELLLLIGETLATVVVVRGNAPEALTVTLEAGVTVVVGVQGTVQVSLEVAQGGAVGTQESAYAGCAGGGGTGDGGITTDSSKPARGTVGLFRTIVDDGNGEGMVVMVTVRVVTVADGLVMVKWFRVAFCWIKQKR